MTRDAGVSLAQCPNLTHDRPGSVCQRPHLTARDPATMDGVALVGTHTFAILIPGREEPDTMTIELFLYILGCVGLVLEAVRVGLPRLSFGWAGLAVIAFTALVLPAL